MSDIVERLRETYESVVTGNDVLRNPDGPEAAARIEQLAAALEWIVGTALTEPEAMVEKARAALEERT